MVIVTLLVLAASIWLLWEWRTGALVPSGHLAGRRMAPTAVGRRRSLPTSAALNVDADVSSRMSPGS